MAEQGTDDEPQVAPQPSPGKGRQGNEALTSQHRPGQEDWKYMQPDSEAPGLTSNKRALNTPTLVVCEGEEKQGSLKYPTQRSQTYEGHRQEGNTTYNTPGGSNSRAAARPTRNCTPRKSLWRRRNLPAPQQKRASPAHHTSGKDRIWPKLHTESKPSSTGTGVARGGNHLPPQQPQNPTQRHRYRSKKRVQ